MLPTFSGNPDGLDPFISTAYLIHDGIAPKDRSDLLQFIRFSSLKGRAFHELKHRAIDTIDDLVVELEAIFRPKRSVAVVQNDLYTSRQRKDEPVKAYANRIGGLLTELLQLSLDPGNSADSNAAIEGLLRKQALIQFNHGLNSRIATIVKASKCLTLQEAISIAIEEDSTYPSYHEPNHNKRGVQQGSHTGNNKKNDNLHCERCDRKGHLAKNCYARLSNAKKPQDKRVSINKISDVCNYCKKPGHTVQECRTLKRKKQRESTQQTSAAESQAEERVRLDTTRLNVLQNSSHRNLIEVQADEFKNRTAMLLFDTGADISIIKAGVLQGKTMINQKENTVTGLGNYPFTTAGTVELHVKIGKHVILHPFQVIPSSFPLIADGILGVDFWEKNVYTVNRDHSITMLGHSWQIHYSAPRTVTLKPRTETLVAAITHSTSEGLATA
ncbi:uncharacterized protein [Prorops nasuta]|uniref:uncharacterized protein n=1 Tax=Prorops nasuta TaxID=863751 RepID=UPI0034D005F3